LEAWERFPTILLGVVQEVVDGAKGELTKDVQG